MQENFYFVLFIFTSQLYFYVLGPISLLGYIRQLGFPSQLELGFSNPL